MNIDFFERERTPHDTRDNAIRETRSLLANHAAGETRVEGYHYAFSRPQHETFMLSGGGPSTWLHFVFNEDSHGSHNIDHAYIEFSDSNGRTLVMVPDHLSETLLIAMRIATDPEDRPDYWGEFEHEHRWGPLEQSRLAGTVHRKCQVAGCHFINALDDDEEDDE